MLFKETVETSTLELLKSIMLDTAFDSFYLVGGTALSLMIGHRKSIDLDLFTSNSFDTQELIDHLRLKYKFELDYVSKNTVKGELRGVQLDFITHQYPLIEEVIEVEGFRIATSLEIAAMKLNAITSNGTRIKDFIDIAFLSSYYTLNTMLKAYETKYKSNKIIALKSLTYFSEINVYEPIIYLSQKPVSWSIIENRIIEMVDKPNNILPKL